ncbi:MAG: crosslink repair DNA glycosylase YcaQ family protein [Caldilineaceae bacterium]
MWAHADGRAKLFDFAYVWEIYKSAHKRQYGPYTMPMLYQDRLVARMDAKYSGRKQHPLRITFVNFHFL